jgi:hypothetical protein
MPAREAAMTGNIEFYDSSRWGLIPAKTYAALYFDGRFRVTPDDAKRFEQVRYITVFGTKAAAAGAGIADFEAGNPQLFAGPALVEWAEERQAMNKLARVYCDRSDAPRAHALVGHLPCVRYWLSTLDGRAWTPAELVADVEAVERFSLPKSLVWGIQWQGGMAAFYDRSSLWLPW